MVRTYGVSIVLCVCECWRVSKMSTKVTTQEPRLTPWQRAQHPTPKIGMATFPDETYTITYGDRGENEAGMQMVGTAMEMGVSAEYLGDLCETLKKEGADVSLCPLNELMSGHEAEDECTQANVLIIKEGVNYFLKEMKGDMEPAAEVLAELRRMPKDDKTYMYGRVVTKKARHNCCMADFEQSPDIANKKGTVVNFNDYPFLDKLRRVVGERLRQTQLLVGEINHYYDSKQCGIGWHGDAERKIVVGVRVGPGANNFPIKFNWFHHHDPVGKEGRIFLDDGDIYIMSEKAVGFDTKKSSLYTLRHAAGKDTCSYAKTKRKRDDPMYTAPPMIWKPSKAPRVVLSPVKEEA